MTEPNTPKPALDAQAGKRTAPPAVWFAAGALAMTAFATLVMTHRREVALLAAVLDLIWLIGLVRGHRWAYVLTIICAVLGVGVAFSKGASHGLTILLGDAVVLIPVLKSTNYFFPEEKPANSSREPNSTSNQQQGNVI